MSTTESLQRRQTIYSTIIKEIDHTDSWESGCVSDDDLSRPISRQYTDAETQTARTFCLNPTCSNFNRSQSVGDILDQSVLPSSEPVKNPCKFQRSNHGSLHSHSPNLYRNGEESQHARIISRMSRSLEHLSLPILRERLTVDSGTGDSMQQLPGQTLTQPVHYKQVPIHGCPPALMANRYYFDPLKVEEYNRKSNTTHSTIELTRKKPRRYTHESLPKKKLFDISSLFRRSSRASTEASPLTVPIVRHHPGINQGQ